MGILKDFEIVELLDIYGKLLTERQLEILKMYYNFDISLSEIAENFKISRQSVNDCINKCKEILINYESKLNLLKRNKEIDLSLDKILEEQDIDKIKVNITNLKNKI